MFLNLQCYFTLTVFYQRVETCFELYYLSLLLTYIFCANTYGKRGHRNMLHCSVLMHCVKLHDKRVLVVRRNDKEENLASSLSELILHFHLILGYVQDFQSPAYWEVTLQN